RWFRRPPPAWREKFLRDRSGPEQSDASIYRSVPTYLLYSRNHENRNHEDSCSWRALFFVFSRFVFSCQLASCTTFFAASSIESAVVKFIPLSFSSRFPSSTFVPSMRMTIGTGT